MNPNTRRKQTPEHIAKRMASRGYVPMTAEHKEKLRLANVGRPSWNKGLKGVQVAWNKGLIGAQVAWNKGMKIRTNTGRTHFKKGQISWQKGKPLNQKQLDAIRQSRLGKKSSLETRLKQGRSHRGLRQGPKCNFWKGGTELLRNLVRDLSESTEWRRLIFERDDYTCRFCGVRGAYIEAHHLKRFADILREFLGRYSMLSPIHDKYRLVELSRRHGPLWDINNGITLCRPCHDKTKGD